MGIREAIKERRLKAFGISKSDLLRMLQQQRDTRIFIPHLNNVPKDAVPLDVIYDFDLDVFKVKIVHPSFDSVSEVESIPYIPTNISIYEIKKDVGNS